MTRPAVDRPLFVVGCGRSGTTLLYGLLALHPAFAWFSNITQRFPSRPELAALSRLQRLGPLRRTGWRVVPYPAEGHSIFDRCRGGARAGDNSPLTESDLGAGEKDALHRVASAHLRYQGGERFLNKNTRNTRRIRYLAAAFPDAHFVHLVRHPRATAASLTRVAFWPDLPIWWAGERTPTDLARDGADPARVAAEFWRREVQQVVDDSSAVPPERFHTSRYEDLVADPVGEVSRLLDFAGVAATSAFVDRLAERPVTNRNVKASPGFDADQLAVVDAEAGPTARTFGYEG